MTNNDKGLIAGIVVCVIFILVTYVPAVMDKRLAKRVDVIEQRLNGTELGRLLRSAQITIPQELAPLDPQSRKYAAGWNDCLHNVKAMLAGKITVNQQTGAIKVRSVDGVKETEK